MQWLACLSTIAKPTKTRTLESKFTPSKRSKQKNNTYVSLLLQTGKTNHESHDFLHLYSDRTDKIFIIISLILIEFSYGEMQKPHLFICSKKLSERYFYACCIFSHNLKQRQNVFASGCVENYRKNSKIWDTSKNCHNCPKNRKVWCNIALMHPKDADGMANSIDPDQTASSVAVWSWSALFPETYLSQYIEFVRYSA